MINHLRSLEYVGRHSLAYYAVNALILNVAELVAFRILHILGATLPVASKWVAILFVTILAMVLRLVHSALDVVGDWCAVSRTDVKEICG